MSTISRLPESSKLSDAYPMAAYGYRATHAVCMSQSCKKDSVWLSVKTGRGDVMRRPGGGVLKTGEATAGCWKMNTGRLPRGTVFLGQISL
jgi:hypothetical protein